MEPRDKKKVKDKLNLNDLAYDKVDW